MQQFSILLREFRTWMQSIKWLKPIMPFHLYFLFGGIAIILLRSLLVTTIYTSSGLYNLFYTFPLGFIGEYGFLLGAWMTLASHNVRFLPYALWGNAFLSLIPFYGMAVHSILVAAVYVILGIYLLMFVNSSYGKQIQSPQRK